MLAVVLWSTSNVIDKNLFLYYFKRPIFGVGFQAMLASVYALLAFIIFDVAFRFAPFMLGAFWLALLLLYFKAMKVEEASRVAAYFSGIPAMVAILAYFFLGERFGIMTYLGIGLIISGGILLSIKKHKSKSRLSKVLPYILLFILIYSVYSILVKHYVNIYGFLTVFSNMQLGIFALGIPFILIYRKDIMKIRPRGLILFAVSHFFAILALFSFFLAASQGPITLISPLLELQGAVVFISATILTLFLPKIIKEDISKDHLILKAIAVFCMTIGAVLVSMYG